jgi:hypothetical protein
LSDLERVVSEAQRAREEAEAAAQRAASLEAQAEAARERARQEEAEQRRQLAQQIIDSYDADVSAADVDIQEAHEHFNREAVSNLPGAIEAYLAWGEASLRHYVLQLRLAAAAPVLNLETSPPEFVAPPVFSAALDAALNDALQGRADAAQQEVDAELARLRTSD